MEVAVVYRCMVREEKAMEEVGTCGCMVEVEKVNEKVMTCKEVEKAIEVAR